MEKKKERMGKEGERGRQILIASMLATSTSSPVEVREGSEKCGLLSTPPMSSTLVRGQEEENPPINSFSATASASVSRTGRPFTTREVMPGCEC